MSDWIDEFVRATDDVGAPEIYRLWTGIVTIAGTLERRVSVRTRKGLIYPNLYVMLVGPPAAGKTTALEPGRILLKGTKHVKLAPNNMTQPALLDFLERCQKPPNPENATKLGIEHASATILASELVVLFPEYNIGLLGTLSDIYDNPETYEDERRTTKNTKLIKPCLSIIVGAQPGALGQLLPDTAWDQGFMSRVIMVYADKGPVVDLFEETVGNSMAVLQKALNQMSQTALECQWHPRTKDLVNEWNKGNCHPVPTHAKLKYYNERRLVNSIKLSMVAMVSRVNGSGAPLVLMPEDFHRAIRWLTDAETLMPRVFAAMTGKSDAQIINELHQYLFKIWSRDKQPIPERIIWDFLSIRATSRDAPYIVSAAEKMGWLEALPGHTGTAGQRLYNVRARDGVYR